jgi:hypothetical protein
MTTEPKSGGTSPPGGNLGKLSEKPPEEPPASWCEQCKIGASNIQTRRLGRRDVWNSVKLPEHVSDHEVNALRTILANPERQGVWSKING